MLILKTIILKITNKHFIKFKKTTKMKSLVKKILAVILLSSAFSFANAAEYSLTVSNLKYTSPKTLEFDIYLLNTSEKEEFRYSYGQYFLEYNPAISNGGTLTYSIVASDLPGNMRPRNPSVSENILRLAVNSINSDKASLPVITSDKPGILVVKMKLETSAEKFGDVPLNLKWTDEKNKLKTEIASFNGKESKLITDSQSHSMEIENTSKEKIQKTAIQPESYSLSQNYPNPFNPTTNIQFEIPENLSEVKLIVYDITGKAVATLINEKLNAGRYDVTFNGSNLASGMYFYKLTAGSFSSVKKLVLIK